MRKLFNFVIALLSMVAVAQSASAVDFSVTVPEGTNACWVVGNFCKWDNNKHKMTKVDATHYTLTVTEADFADQTVTQATIKYKYLSGGGDWAYVEKDAAGAEIPDRDWTAADVVAKWALVWADIPAAPKFVDINVLVPVAVNQVYLVGNFCNWALPTDSTKMTLVESTPDGKIFTKHIWTPDAHKLQYKFVAGPAWDYQQTNANNFIFPAAESSVSEVVSAFNAIYDPTKLGDVSMTINVPLGTDSVWVQGSAFGWSWNTPAALACTKVADGKFSFVVKSIMSMEYRMYNRPDWDHPEVGEADPTKELANRIAGYPADATLAITVWGWKNIVQGINSLTKDNYNVTSSNQSVSVTNVKSQVELFNAAGQRVVSEKANGTFTSKKLNAGMYIVRVDGVTRKVVVK